MKKDLTVHQKAQFLVSEQGLPLLKAHLDEIQRKEDRPFHITAGILTGLAIGTGAWLPALGFAALSGGLHLFRKYQ